MNNIRIEIIPFDNVEKNHGLRDTINREKKLSVTEIFAGKYYYISSKDDTSIKEKISHIATDVFCDTVIEEFSLEGDTEAIKDHNYDYVVQVGFKPGVTDNPGNSAMDALELIGLNYQVYSGTLFYISGQVTKEEVEVFAKEFLANGLIQSIEVYLAKDFKTSDRFSNIELPLVKINHETSVKIINIDQEDDVLVKMSDDNCWALSLEELQFIRKYYLDEKENRLAAGMPEMPTDVEIEVIAQTWSEHCKHKIFSAQIDYSEDIADEKDNKKLGKMVIDGLYKSYIKKSTKDIETKRELDWLISVFSDNAGIVRFDDHIDLCIKAETHNSPSALDPYGGAITGILGVNRDILGCGLGAKPIANTDVFCFADPELPNLGDEKLLPKGLMNPKRILEGVHAGVEDGGNKSGVPTVNGAIYFDRDYAGKPLVFVGTIGAMPRKLPDGRNIEEKNPAVGDRIVMVGGAVGADGIHGATFSSLDLNENSPVTAVQIGDPLTQKRVLDFLLEARDLGLYSCVTDNGAGGLSSSVGEMALYTGGGNLDLEKCPVKYPGLSAFELMISESQERMTFAVPENKLEAFMKLAIDRNVEASDLGDYNDSGILKVYYGDEIVADLNLHFLHEALPQMKLKATWNGQVQRQDWSKSESKNDIDGVNTQNAEEILTTLLRTPNIVSKESWVRQYDHEVQGATQHKPFNGETGSGPNNSGGIWLHPHGGEKNNGVLVGCGLNPRASLYDPFVMGQMAVDEAVRNVVAQGGDIDHLCLLDNFCWPDPVKSQRNPEGEYKLGQLVRTCAGLDEICRYYGTPLVSGKDSMKNDFRGKNRNGDDLTISVLPTLLVTAMSKYDVRHTTNSAYKNADDNIYLLGSAGNGLLASEYAQTHTISKTHEKLPTVDLEKNYKLYKTIFKAMKTNVFSSCHDISDGGLMVALVESCFGNKIGAEVDLTTKNNDELVNLLFNEEAGRFVVSINSSKVKEFESLFSETERTLLGKTTSNFNFCINDNSKSLLKTKGDELFSAWTREL